VLLRVSRRSDLPGSHRRNQLGIRPLSQPFHLRPSHRLSQQGNQLLILPCSRLGSQHPDQQHSRHVNRQTNRHDSPPLTLPGSQLLNLPLNRHDSRLTILQHNQHGSRLFSHRCSRPDSRPLSRQEHQQRSQQRNQQANRRRNPVGNQADSHRLIQLHNLLCFLRPSPPISRVHVRPCSQRRSHLSSPQECPQCSHLEGRLCSHLLNQLHNRQINRLDNPLLNLLTVPVDSLPSVQHRSPRDSQLLSHLDSRRGNPLLSRHASRQVNRRVNRQSILQVNQLDSRLRRRRSIRQDSPAGGLLVNPRYSRQVNQAESPQFSRLVSRACGLHRALPGNQQPNHLPDRLCCQRCSLLQDHLVCLPLVLVVNLPRSLVHNQQGYQAVNQHDSRRLNPQGCHRGSRPVSRRNNRQGNQPVSHQDSLHHSHRESRALHHHLDQAANQRRNRRCSRVHNLRLVLPDVPARNQRQNQVLVLHNHLVSPHHSLPVVRRRVQRDGRHRDRHNSQCRRLLRNRLDNPQVNRLLSRSVVLPPSQHRCQHWHQLAVPQLLGPPLYQLECR
jgi:hypothetical protein